MKRANKNTSILLLMGGGLAILLFIILLNKREGFQKQLKCYNSGIPPQGGKCCDKTPAGCYGVCGAKKCGLKSDPPAIFVAPGVTGKAVTKKGG